MTKLQRARATLACCYGRPLPSDGFDQHCEVVKINRRPGFDQLLWSETREQSHWQAASLALDGYPAKWPRAAARKGTER